MRAIWVGALVIFMVGACPGQTTTPAQPEQNSEAKQSTEVKQKPEAKPLTVPETPQIDFEARLQQMLKGGKIKPGRVVDYRDYAHMDGVPVIFLPGYCFTMRTYTFSRQSDGSAPKLKGVSTCTRGNDFQLREAKPDARNYPPQ